MLAKCFDGKNAQVAIELLDWVVENVLWNLVGLACCKSRLTAVEIVLRRLRVLTCLGRGFGIDGSSGVGGDENERLSFSDCVIDFAFMLDQLAHGRRRRE